MTTDSATVPTTRQRPLNARQKGFCRNVVANGGNATKAYEDAGYSPNGAKVSASKLLTNPNVQAEIAALEAAQQEADEVNREFVVSGLRDLALNASTESSRVRSYELLGKFLGMFREQVEVHAVQDVTPLAEFSIAELRALRASLPVEVEARVVD